MLSGVEWLEKNCAASSVVGTGSSICRCQVAEVALPAGQIVLEFFKWQNLAD